MEQEMIGLASKMEPGLAAGAYTLKASQDSSIPDSKIFLPVRCGSSAYAADRCLFRLSAKGSLWEI
mgnify:CR=1 FL=1